MKNLFKNSTILAGLIAVSFAAKAQTSTSTTTSSNGIIYSVGVDGGFSAGSFKHTNKWDLGGTVQADIPVANQFFLDINAGYLNFYGKNNVYGSGIQAEAVRLLPVKAGLKYFVFTDIYVQADAGVGFALNKSDLDYQRTAAFLYTPQVGVQLPIGKKQFIDAGAYYEASTKYTSGVDNTKINFFGLRAAYAFGL
jgi:hypothetical protein